MKQRSAIGVTLLSLFIPFYSLYWFYSTCQELRKRGVEQVPKIIMFFIPLFVLLGGYFLLLVAQAAGVNKTTLNILSIPVGMIGIVLCIVLPILFYLRFSRAVASATKQNVGPLIFILFLLIWPIAVYIAQKKINETTANNNPLPPVVMDLPAIPPASTVPAMEPIAPQQTPPTNPIV